VPLKLGGSSTMCVEVVQLGAAEKVIFFDRATRFVAALPMCALVVAQARAVCEMRAHVEPM